MCFQGPRVVLQDRLSNVSVQFMPWPWSTRPKRQAPGFLALTLPICVDDGLLTVIARCSKGVGEAPDDEAGAGVSAHERPLSCCTAECSFPTLTMTGSLHSDTKLRNIDINVGGGVHSMKQIAVLVMTRAAGIFFVSTGALAVCAIARGFLVK